MISKSPKETIEFGRIIAEKLRGGEVIGLTGELGSGKTTFIKGLAQGLKIKENITSPTFVFMKNYPAKIGRKKIELVHLDCYRLKSNEDDKSIGIEDYLNRQDVIIVIEWPEKIRQILPKKTIDINFKHIKPNQREINVS